VKSLDKNWFSSGLIDLEYKQYILLDYFQFVQNSFKENNLFPVFQNLISTYKSTQEYKNNINIFKESIKMRTLVGVDMSGPKLIYEESVEQDDMVDEMERIVDFSIPLFQENIKIGKEIYDSIDNNLEIKCVGIEPLYNLDGYMTVRHNKVFIVYKYTISIIHENTSERSRIMNMEEVCRYKSTLTNNIDSIKTKLIKKFDSVNPAVYFVDATMNDLSLDNALLPIIKRKFLLSYFF